MVVPRRMTKRCIECQGGMMEGEFQAIPTELELPLFQKIDSIKYMPQIIRKHQYYEVYVCNNCGSLKIFLR